MRVLFLLIVFYINYVISNEEKHAFKTFPKKVPGQILMNFGKYVNKPKSIKLKPLATNPDWQDSKYTVFLAINQTKDLVSIPDSPYFPAEPTLVQKPRVKKVLPDYVWTSLVRHRRSAEPLVPKTDNKTDNQSVGNVLSDKKLTVHQKNDTKNPNAAKIHHSAVQHSGAALKSKVEDSKLVKKVNLNPRTKSQLKPIGKSLPNVPKKVAANRARSGNKYRLVQKKAKSKQVARKISKAAKSRGVMKPKTRLRGKIVGRNGSAMKKSGIKKQGRSKSKLRQRSKKSLRLRKKSKKPSLRINKKSKKRTNMRTSLKKQGRKGKIGRSKTPAETRRLIAGKEALIEDYPYVVSIQKDEEHWCSGALLNPMLVVTTANCLWKSKRISRMVVRAGSSYTDRGGQVAEIQEVRKHPRWGLRKNPDNDVALVLLDRKIKFSHSVHAVDLPNRAMYPAFDDAWVASWGAERRDGIYETRENTLQVYHTMVISHELCNNITSRFGVIVTKNFICLSQPGRTSPCTRDTGAPAVSDGILWGIASWGLRKLCGTERFPSMFTYIASESNMNFITNATSYLMSDERLRPFQDRPLRLRAKGAPNNHMADEIDRQLSFRRP